MFPVAVDVIRTIEPRAFIFENVKGIASNSLKEYFRYILLQLSYPDVKQKLDEDWSKHLTRLEALKKNGTSFSLEYKVSASVLNAADYGVPQRRERVFIVGYRVDQCADWKFPDKTHSLDVLLYQQWITGEYWERHKVPKAERPDLQKQLVNRVRKLNNIAMFEQESLLPWSTVRDALADLPDPYVTNMSNMYFDHNFKGGARVYTGHTGSSLDMPAKALKAGSHGVPGGENMMVLPNGDVRYFTIRESARLQTFPDEYRFHGSWTEATRQLGNAVPVDLAQVLGSSVAMSLKKI